MKRFCILSVALAVLPACSGDDTSPGGSANDASTTDSSVEDTGTPEDSATPTPDTGSPKPDTGTPTDAGVTDADAAVVADGGDGGCPSSWYVVPVTDPSIAVPDGGGGLLLHAIGTGTQNYMCKANPSDAGAPYTWQLVTPEANLTDCHNTLIGHHFASEAGASFPEWQTNDGTYVIGTKKAAFTPDGGSTSIAWLLVSAVDGGGSSALSMTDYIQRLNTDGGLAPATGCSVDGGDVGATTDIGYTADYYFYGP
jgi:Protein of unknown function (DUF3455)